MSDAVVYVAVAFARAVWGAWGGVGEGRLMRPLGSRRRSEHSRRLSRLEAAAWGPFLVARAERLTESQMDEIAALTEVHCVAIEDTIRKVTRSSG